ncbi:MAG: PspC domain-containing protein [Actinobacteria bacterium]|nr:PspC domain-containing protein [Actinomycetota bacterium]
MTTPPNTTSARLYRSRDDRVIAGVTGGLAGHLNIDPVLVRLGLVVLAFAGGGGILAYLIGWIVIPEEPNRPDERRDDSSPTRPAPASGTARMVVGIALVAIGVGLLTRIAIPALAGIFWPLAVVGAGAALIFYGATR